MTKLDDEIMRKVKETLSVVPNLEDGEFTREAFGDVYDRVCKELLELQDEHQCNIFDYAWVVGEQKGYSYPPDMFRDMG